MVDQEGHGPHQGGGRRLAAAHEHVEQDALERLEALKRWYRKIDFKKIPEQFLPNLALISMFGPTDGTDRIFPSTLWCSRDSNPRQ